MQISRFFLLASAITINATPVIENLDKRNGYTCQQAYNDCQGSGKGNYVCWSNSKTQQWGTLTGEQLSTE
jgi:hypothetical protein